LRGWCSESQSSADSQSARILCGTEGKHGSIPPHTARRQDRPSAHEQIQAICGIKPDGSHWSLTQNEAISQVEEGTSIFYVERAGGRRLDVIVAMDLHAHKYLKTVADGQQPDELFYLPNCPNVAHEISRSARAGR